MILDLAKYNVSQAQALALLDDLETIEENIVKGLRPTPLLELTIEERDQFIRKLRSAAAQFTHLAHQINLNS